MMTATYNRLTTYAYVIGSRAVTLGGMLRAVKAHGLPAAFVPWRVVQPSRTLAKHDDDKTYGRCLAAAKSAAKAGVPNVDASSAFDGALVLAGADPKQFPLYYSYFRMVLGLTSHPLCPIGGEQCRAAGTGGHNSRGGWTYYASTLRGLIGTDAIVRIAASGGLKRWRGAGGGVYRIEPAYTRGGVSVHYCAGARGRMWLVITPDGYGYHYRNISRDADTVAEFRRAARTALQAMRTRLALAVERQRTIDLAPRVWVSVRDSLQSGNCKPVTLEVKRQVERLLEAEGEIGAVRGDVVLKLRRNDSYSLRAVAAAIERMGL